MGRGHLALGDLRAAEGSLDAALTMESDLGAPLFAARTMLDQARLSLRRGRALEATQLASEVRASAERLQLDALAAEARRVGGGPLSQPTGLSPRERQVLALVTEGASNKDVASALVISLNTVERHLANIYTKLGVRGRAEAAAHAVRTGLVAPAKNGGFP